jgi:hypothetical protein
VVGVVVGMMGMMMTVVMTWPNVRRLRWLLPEVVEVRESIELEEVGMIVDAAGDGVVVVEFEFLAFVVVVVGDNVDDTVRKLHVSVMICNHNLDVVAGGAEAGAESGQTAADSYEEEVQDSHTDEGCKLIRIEVAEDGIGDVRGVKEEVEHTDPGKKGVDVVVDGIEVGHADDDEVDIEVEVEEEDVDVGLMLVHYQH